MGTRTNQSTGYFLVHKYSKQRFETRVYMDDVEFKSRESTQE
jgi:hypothetical protein